MAPIRTNDSKRAKVFAPAAIHPAEELFILIQKRKPPTEAGGYGPREVQLIYF
jgi:hypothetical protein